MVSVSAIGSPVAGSLPLARSMMMAFLPSPLSWMSATSATTDSAPAAGSGAESRISCEPCSSFPQLNDPTSGAAAKPMQQITAKVGSTCCGRSWLFSVVNARSPVPAPTPRA